STRPRHRPRHGLATSLGTASPLLLAQPRLRPCLPPESRGIMQTGHSLRHFSSLRDVSIPVCLLNQLYNGGLGPPSQVRPLWTREPLVSLIPLFTQRRWTDLSVRGFSQGHIAPVPGEPLTRVSLSQVTAKKVVAQPSARSPKPNQDDLWGGRPSFPIQ